MPSFGGSAVDSDEWDILVKRINGLWGPPNMTGDAVGAYFDELKPFTFGQVQTAISALAKGTTGSRRPSVGAICDVALAQERTKPEPAKVPDRDLLDDSQHRYTMLQLSHDQTPEHKRRLAAVLSIGRRLSFRELSELLPEKSCSAAEFDERIAKLREQGGPDRPLAIPQGRPRRRLLSTDPEAGDDD